MGGGRAPGPPTANGRSKNSWLLVACCDKMRVSLLN